MIFVNFKNYLSGQGVKGQQLQQLCKEVATATGVTIYSVINNRWARGVLLNHSSCPATYSQIKNFMSNFPLLKTLICCSSLEEGLKLARLRSTYLAYEPPELIGGQISVSTARPAIIKDFVDQIRFLPILVGAGIHNSNDVSQARRLGAAGVLVSSAVMAASHPRQVLLDLTRGFR